MNAYDNPVRSLPMEFIENGTIKKLKKLRIPVNVFDDPENKYRAVTYEYIRNGHPLQKKLLQKPKIAAKIENCWLWNLRDPIFFTDDVKRYKIGYVLCNKQISY